MAVVSTRVSNVIKFLGKERFLEELIQSLGTDELEHCVDFIVRMQDIDAAEIEPIETDKETILDRMTDGYSNDEVFWSELAELTKGE